jgi:hypothetical protein
MRGMAATSRTHIRNPLTLMAVFATLAEVAATVALPRLSSDAQNVFLWFVMSFPFSIVIPFFILLWHRPKHLYAPGDYRKDPIWLTDQEPPMPVDAQHKMPKSKERPLTETTKEKNREVGQDRPKIV